MNQTERKVKSSHDLKCLDIVNVKNKILNLKIMNYITNIIDKITTE